MEEQIREIEDEIRRTPYNKATQQHIGRLKAKLAHLREESETRRARKGKGKGYSIRKSGNATVAIVGFPSVGKSTLLNKITNAQSEVGSYDFTTLEVVPGVMEYRGAKIQILDLPGLIRDASRGKGRGREIISVVRTSDLIILVIDVFETHLELLVEELSSAGVRLNISRPDIQITKRIRGGIDISSTVALTKIDEPLIKDAMREFGIANASVLIREDIDVDRLIDALSKNRHYASAIAIINKIDLVSNEYLKEIENRMDGWDLIPISAEKDTNLDFLKERIFETLDLIRVYMKPQGQQADLKEPLVVRRGTNIAGVCASLHRDFKKNFRYAQIWGGSAKFPGQMVGLDHVVDEGDLITIVVKR
ncbi:MAG TPA: GTP-binding protein [Euryarchaeota archaeon]|nr:GTP-binding protein [Euryarchaeota archaeon]